MALCFVDDELTARPGAMEPPGRGEGAADVTSTVDQGRRDPAQAVHPLEDGRVEKGVVGPVVGGQRDEAAPELVVVPPWVASVAALPDRDVVVLPIGPRQGGGVADL